MKAILFHEHGGPEVLQYTDFPTPEPKVGEVLIRIRAAALNRMDVFVRNGWQGLKLEMPHINGADGAGEIVAFGESKEKIETRELAIGDRVAINANLGCGECEFCKIGKDNLCRNWHLLGETIRGTYAEYICLPIRQLYKLPNDFDFHQSAAAALVYQTAWHSMVKRGKVIAGETVAIVGAGGGVNSASIQIAKYLGAKVIVIGSNAKKLSQAESLGADILIDRSKEEDWSKVVFLATIDNRFIFAKHLSIIGSTMSTLSDFTEVMDLVVTGKLKPILDKTYDLKDAALAQERLWRGENFGKITLNI